MTNINFAHLLAVGFGGFAGAVLRFYITIIVNKYYFPMSIPYATLGVNVIGSFLIGLLIALFLHITPNESLKLFLITGFLGALTTYSTFAIESFLLFDKSFFLAISNMLLNVILTVVFAGMGYKIVIYFLK